MRCSFTTACLVLAGFTALGCRQAAEPPTVKSPAIRDSASQESPEVDLAMLRYDTGDVQEWPDYHFPLQYSFDVPEVPPEIVGPFSPQDIPSED